jgi:hypothetical protein
MLSLCDSQNYGIRRVPKGTTFRAFGEWSWSRTERIDSHAIFSLRAPAQVSRDTSGRAARDMPSARA